MNKSDFPLISVIIPLYNCESMIGEALDSVFAQTYPNIEVIVVDDGSTDGSRKVVAQYAEVQYIYQENQGPADARNNGIAYCKGEIIAFLDADDLFPLGKLMTQYRYFAEDTNLLIVRGLVKWVYLKNKENYVRQFFHNEEEQTNFNTNLGAGLYRKIVFDRIGVFDKIYTPHEDTDFWNRIRYHKIKTVDVEEVGLIYQIHDKNITLDKNAFGKGMIQAFLRKKERFESDPNCEKAITRTKIY